MMITSSFRQGIYFIFLFLFLFVGVYWMKWFGFFEYFLIICLTGILLKLTDIEEAIREIRR
ncbi:MAG: hypothetical protein E3J56_01125 [Candidatus Aminicenantes bacterium]|nr:MAG: hypothetical protein E3J56_01125 [Candidatus Aminicenantes bacterium]